MARSKRNIAVRILAITSFLLAVGGATVFHLGTAKPNPAITATFANMDLTRLPPLEHYRARDGASLSFRRYAASGKRVAVLIHGSAGSSQDMHVLATALQTAGVNVIVPDLRGHGGNWPHGDIRYLGQLDDDMADMVAALLPAYPGAPWTLLGFSSGGGFALRLAAEEAGARFDSFVLLSPYLHYDAATERPAVKGEPQWYRVSVPRIVALTILGSFGIHIFDGIRVLAFPVPANIEATTATYSFRMQANFQPHDDYLGDIRRVSRPMQVLVGTADDLFLPEKFAPVFASENATVKVALLPGVTHSGMVTDPVAIQAVVKAVSAEIASEASRSSGSAPMAEKQRGRSRDRPPAGLRSEKTSEE